MSHRRGKRDRPHPYYSSSSFKKLRRHDDAGGDDSTVSGAGDGGVDANPSPSSFVMVSGLPSDCSVLELKSRLEMYGSISRTRIDAEDAAGYVTFRSPLSAASAVAASPIPFRGSTKVILSRIVNPLPLRRTAAGASASASASSKLLRAEIPLSKHGRSNKMLTTSTTSTKTALDLPFKGRQIVAYDDLL